MGWASSHIQKLLEGTTVSFRPRGNSMSGKIASGQLCTVAPVDTGTLQVGDIVLCKVNGREYLHLIKAIQGPRFQIGNNRGRVNGWVSAGAIFGRLVRVEAYSLRLRFLPTDGWTGRRNGRTSGQDSIIFVALTTQIVYDRV